MQKFVFQELAKTTPNSNLSAFYEELTKRAIQRENELLAAIKVLKNEVNSLRSRLSIIGPSTNAATPATPNSARTKISNNILSTPSAAAAFTLTESTDHPISEGERQQRLLYLRQAFVGFFKAKHAVEMQHLGRVICAILGVSIEEQGMILDSISKLTPAVVASSTFDSFSQSFASIFS